MTMYLCRYFKKHLQIFHKTPKMLLFINSYTNIQFFINTSLIKYKNATRTVSTLLTKKVLKIKGVSTLNKNITNC